MALKHTKNSAIADSGDTTLVQPSDWNADHVVDTDGLLFTAGSGDPATPGANTLAICARSVAGRIMPRFVDPNGGGSVMQPHIAVNRVAWVAPNTGTSVTSGGLIMANTATIANPTPASTNRLTQARRFTLTTTATTAGTIASYRGSVLELWRGNAANLGGFSFVIRFGTELVQATARGFVGVIDLTTAAANQDWTTATANSKIGMAFNLSGSAGNWSVVHNVAGTAPTVIALGASYPVNQTDLYELAIHCAPNGTGYGWHVRRLAQTGITFTGGSISTNMPANTTFMTPYMWMTNNSTVGNVTLAATKIYIESDD